MATRPRRWRRRNGKAIFDGGRKLERRWPKRGEGPLAPHHLRVGLEILALIADAAADIGADLQAMRAEDPVDAVGELQVLAILVKQITGEAAEVAADLGIVSDRSGRGADEAGAEIHPGLLRGHVGKLLARDVVKAESELIHQVWLD